jgi:uncharacterized protein (DUF924 family)
MTTIEDVLGFWFEEPATDAAELALKLKRWYRGGPAEDAAIRARFLGAVERALAGELDVWAATPRGRVALVLLLDLMARAIYRGTPRSFAGDRAAQALALGATLDPGRSDGLGFEERIFLTLPLLHAENAALLDTFITFYPAVVASAPAWARPLLADGIEQGAKYRELIRRFGRFPQRNAALSRPSTPEEEAFLQTWELDPKVFARLFGAKGG